MKLIINNSYSQITGLTSKPFNDLRKILSYEVDQQQAYFSKNKYNTRKYLIDTKGHFPTGLLKEVTAFLKDNNLKVEVLDQRKRPNNAKKLFKATFPFAPYQAQITAVSKAVKTSRGTISMPTGTGKSLVIALLVAELGVKTLIVVPNLELKRQLTEDFERIFSDTKNITIENIDSKSLDTNTKYDLVLIDEAHHSAASTYQKLNKTRWNDIYYRFFITATPFRNNDAENLLFKAIAGDIIYKLSYSDAVNHGYIVPVDAFYVEIAETKNDCYTWQECYSTLVVNNETRNKTIVSILEHLEYNNVSTLCLVKEVKHGEILSEMMGGVPFANGKDESSRQFIQDFSKGRINMLIGTESLLGEGVDTKPCQFVIIAGLGKAKSSFMQKVGRSVRRYEGKESGKVIIFKDKSHKFTIKHFKEQCKILLEEYGVIPERLDI